MTRDEEVLYLARKLKYLREAGPNSGLRVNGVQRWCDGHDGEPWCLYFATMVLDIAYEGQCAVKRMGSCEALHKIAFQKGWVTTTPGVADLALRVSNTGWAHHAYLLTDVSRPDVLGTISGNTSEDGLSSEGTGVFEHEVQRSDSLVYIHYPREQVA